MQKLKVVLKAFYFYQPSSFFPSFVCAHCVPPSLELSHCLNREEAINCRKGQCEQLFLTHDAQHYTMKIKFALLFIKKNHVLPNFLPCYYMHHYLPTLTWKHDMLISFLLFRPFLSSLITSHPATPRQACRHTFVFFTSVGG